MAALGRDRHLEFDVFRKNQQLSNRHFDNNAKHQEEHHRLQDEAMLARRPLHGWTCISCERNLTNYYGQQPAEHQSWSKLPFRDPTDRIARVGQGFSKMLSVIKPEGSHGPTAKEDKTTLSLSQF